MQWYPADPLNDMGLKLCSLAAQGLWYNMLWLMFFSPERGVLLQANGSRLQAGELSQLVGKPEAEVKQSLSELQARNVCSTRDDGAVYNRRMLRDAKQIASKREAGRKGGLRRAAASRAQAKARSSSSSSSSTSNKETEKKDAPTKKAKRKPKPKTPLDIVTEAYMKHCPAFTSKRVAKRHLKPLFEFNFEMEEILAAIARADELAEPWIIKDALLLTRKTTAAIRQKDTKRAGVSADAKRRRDKLKRLHQVVQSGAKTLTMRSGTTVPVFVTGEVLYVGTGNPTDEQRPVLSKDVDSFKTV